MKVLLILLSISSCFDTSESFATSVPTQHAAQKIPRIISTHLAKSGTDSSTSTSPKRRPWDLLRFVRQSAQFITPPNPLRRPADARPINPGDVLFSPSSPDNVLTFAPLDDVVMGGASSSQIDSNTGLWTGTVTDANSGGFVGIRSKPFSPPLDMSQCSGIELRLREGEGRRFKFVIRDSDQFNGIGWTTSFDAPRGSGGLLKRNRKEEGGSVGVVRVPFKGQVPALFARTVQGQTFQKNNVVGVQLAYSKFEYDGDLNPNFSLGDFSLQIAEVRAY